MLSIFFQAVRVEVAKTMSALNFLSKSREEAHRYSISTKFCKVTSTVFSTLNVFATDDYVWLFFRNLEDSSEEVRAHAVISFVRDLLTRRCLARKSWHIVAKITFAFVLSVLREALVSTQKASFEFCWSCWTLIHVNLSELMWERTWLHRLFWPNTALKVICKSFVWKHHSRIFLRLQVVKTFAQVNCQDKRVIRSLREKAKGRGALAKWVTQKLWGDNRIRVQQLLLFCTVSKPFTNYLSFLLQRSKKSTGYSHTQVTHGDRFNIFSSNKVPSFQMCSSETCVKFSESWRNAFEHLREQCFPWLFRDGSLDTVNCQFSPSAKSYFAWLAQFLGDRRKMNRRFVWKFTDRPRVIKLHHCLKWTRLSIK